MITSISNDLLDIIVGIIAISSNAVVNSFTMEYDVAEVREKYNMSSSRDFFHRFNYYFKLGFNLGFKTKRTLKSADFKFKLVSFKDV